jgi:6-phosphogluconolactonase
MQRASLARAGPGLMRIDVRPTAAAAAAWAASLIAAQLEAAVNQRGRGTLAVSGGRTPTAMLRELARAELPWSEILLFQVDERIVAMNDERRNLKQLLATFSASLLPQKNIHSMPVDRGPDENSAEQYFDDLCSAIGTPPQLDVVHLGLGNDGHTASLFAGDPAAASDRDVAISGIYQGLRRMTLTLRMLDRARQRIWLVTGSDKREIVSRFLDADAELVANHVRREDSIVVLDRAAAGEHA